MANMDPETVDALIKALPAVLRQLVELASGDDRACALKATALLQHYLRDPRSIAATAALKTPEAASMHLSALAWCEDRQRTLARAP